MKIKKHAGFTLVELLAVIVILAILSSLAIVSYNKIVEKSKKAYYKTEEEMLNNAGKEFFNDNKGKLPTAGGEKSCVSLNTLIKFRYIEKILDYNKKACNVNTSKVCAAKLSDTKYLYTPYLDCNNTYQTETYNKPTIQFSLAKGTNITNTPNKDYQMKLTISDSANSSKLNPGVASYRYVIYKKIANKDDLVFYDTGWKTYKDQTKLERTVNITLDSKGTYYLKAWAYNRGGENSDAESGSVILTYILDCSKQIKFIAKNYTNGTWTNNNINVDIEKKGAVESFDVLLNNNSTQDILFSKYMAKIYNAKITKEGISNLEVVCYDDEGNTSKVKSNDYKIDKTKPTCTVTGSNTTNSWSKEDILLQANCIDNGGSGCKQKTVEKKITTDTSTSSITIQVADNAGNTNTCSGSSYLDKTSPTCTVTATGTVGKDNWYTSNVSIALSKTDPKKNNVNSGIFEYGLLNTNSKTYNNTSALTLSTDTTGTTYYGYVKDKANNENTCSKTVKKDSTVPNLSFRGYLMKKDSNGNYQYVNTSGDIVTSANRVQYSFGSWTKYSVLLEANGIDSTSGIDTTTYNYNVKYGSATGNGDSTVQNQANNIWINKNQRRVDATGESNVRFKVSDKAGNTKTLDWVLAKVDKKKPEVSTKQSGGKITVTGTDADSGINAVCLRKKGTSCTWTSRNSNVYTVTNGTYYAKVKDNASNVSDEKEIIVKTEKTYDDVTSLNTKYRYATIGNGSNGSSVLYNQEMNVSNLTVYKNCYNCNTNSWKNTGNQYVSTKIAFAKTTDTKKIKVSLDLTNNVGTYLMASADKDYIRKICFTTSRKYSEASCYNNQSITIKGANDNWQNGSKPSVELSIPQESGKYAIKIFSPNCDKDCNPYQTGGNCNGYKCSGIATFQTDYVIEVK